MVFQDMVVIFDLDGTLVDSAPDLANAMNHVLALEGHPPLPLEKVRGLVGNGARALLERGFAEYDPAGIAEEEMQRHIGRFIDWYVDHIADESRPFPGCESMLDALAANGAALAVCTNKTEKLGFALLDATGLTDRFDTIICRDTLATYKPAPEPLLECVNRTGRGRGVMIGDTMTDLSAALSAGMPCLIASFGYGRFTDEQKKKAGWFDAFDALPGLLSNL
ncbi:HAD-IA family hydrolase [Aquisalinus flavus]|uniref:Phosphoglycolate phosphatase n=1 Tax=Aquisalinus flavus TaxID=1526572 RepID=A0A8J2V557_9PROT|nr:HAD-IA family hydrolase [Aquisalinus flavus]MBD0426416.1 HAD-IA family hydrolase [Aquisalinus flavus]UNE48029.1 HAD-IA family hydrolase [Aquisalinus flavus]GGD08087.1 phosphoglycolate phosphatase, bacterial [Aquisalinus flavus]